jgi:hypothetical protein
VLLFSAFFRNQKGWWLSATTDLKLFQSRDRQGATTFPSNLLRNELSHRRALLIDYVPNRLLYVPVVP